MGQFKQARCTTTRIVKKSIRANFQIKATLLTAAGADQGTQLNQNLNLRQQNRGSNQRRQLQQPVHTISALP